jgi:hypothetical protein
MSDTPAETSPPAHVRPERGAAAEHGRSRGWGRTILGALFWLVVVVLALLIIAAVAVELVLGTGFPRQLIVSQVERELGLQVDAAEAEVGWTGQTTLRNLTLALPLGDQAFLAVPEMRVHHRWLPGILAGQSLDIRGLELHGPELIVREDEAGRWNVLEVLELLGQVGTADPQPEAPRGPMQIPRLQITEATVRVIDNEGREATIYPVHVEGRPDGLRWVYQGRVPDQLEATGRLVPGGAWRHEVDVRLQNIHPWLAAWTEAFPEDAYLSGTWEARYSEGVLRGRMVVGEAQALGFAATGVIEVEGDVGEAVYTIRPESLTVQMPTDLTPELQVTGGTLIVDRERARLQDVRLIGAGGMAQVTGRYAFRSGEGDLDARWLDLALPQGVTHSGQAQARLRMPWPGRPSIDVDLVSRGQHEAGSWEVDAALGGRGPWKAIDWQFVGRRLAVTPQGEDTLLIRDLRAVVESRGPRLVLTRLSAAGEGHLVGRGAVNLRARDWWLYVEASPFTLPQFEQYPLNAYVNLWGDPDHVHVEQIYLRMGALEMAIGGAYVFDDPQPVDVGLHLAHQPPQTGPTPGEADPFIRGQLRSASRARGTISPLLLNLEGELIARNLVVGGRRIGNVDGRMTGEIDGFRGHFRSEELTLFGGQWRLEGLYPHEDEDGRMFLGMDWRNVSLEEMRGILGRDDISGQVEGEILINTPRLDLEALRATGEIRGRDVVVEEIRFEAEQIEAPLALQYGWLDIRPIRMAQEQGVVEARLGLFVRDPEKLLVQMEAEQWPVGIEETGGRLELWSRSDLWLELDRMAATGQFVVEARTFLGEQHLGDAAVQVQLFDRIISLEDIRGEIFGGQIEGRGSINMDDLLRSRVRLRWREIEAEQVAAMWPMLGDLHGRFSGRVYIAAATDPRAFEPVRIHLQLLSDGGRFRAMEIGNTEGSLFLGPTRVVLQRTPIQVGGGIVHLGGQVSRRDVDRPFHQARELSAQVIVDYDWINLNQIVQTGDPGRDPLEGRLSGTIQLAGNPRQPELLFGSGTVSIVRSELVNFAPLALLYDAGGVLGRGGDGEGTASLRFGGGAVDINDIRYFGRGLQIRGLMRIENLWQVGESPISGYASGTARPLRDIRLPLVRDVDQIFDVLQRELTTVRIEGTLGSPSGSLVPFGEATDTLRRFIMGEVQGRR